MGDPGEGWNSARRNAAFRHIMEGAEFVALQRNRYWDTGEGLALDAGTFVAALEYATGREATLAGKPSPMFFQAAAESMGVELFNLAVVGDDPGTAVAGAPACDAARVLGRTGRSPEGAPAPAPPRREPIPVSAAVLPGRSRNEDVVQVGELVAPPTRASGAARKFRLRPMWMPH